MSNNKLLSILLATCLSESTLEIIIKTTPDNDATTNGKIKAPKNITEEKYI